MKLLKYIIAICFFIKIMSYLIANRAVEYPFTKNETQLKECVNILKNNYDSIKEETSFNAENNFIVVTNGSIDNLSCLGKNRASLNELFVKLGLESVTVYKNELFIMTYFTGDGRFSWEKKSIVYNPKRLNVLNEIGAQYTSIVKYEALDINKWYLLVQQQSIVD